MPLRHGLRIEESRIWVIHRLQEYGPFDYEWSSDLQGMEMTYQGQKFGEYCNSREFFADLSEFNLPTSVYSVATIALGTLIQSILNGRPSSQREGLILRRLENSEFSKYATFDDEK
ncbi:MAG: hypothetical protein R3C11_17895 [Planctomycetaceae bacterium]